MISRVNGFGLKELASASVSLVNYIWSPTISNLGDPKGNVSAGFWGAYEYEYVPQNELSPCEVAAVLVAVRVLKTMELVPAVIACMLSSTERVMEVASQMSTTSRLNEVED